MDLLDTDGNVKVETTLIQDKNIGTPTPGTTLTFLGLPDQKRWIFNVFIEYNV